MSTTKLLRASQLIDGLGNPPQTNPAVLVEAGRIKDVILGSTDSLPAADVVLDFPGGTILPGFIDAHVHLTMDPSQYDTPKFLQLASDTQLYELGKKQAQQFLQVGVTTVRDLGARGQVTLNLRRDMAASSTAAARMLVAGPPVTSANGHMHYIGVEVAPQSDLKAIITNLIDQGVDLIKIVATGGGVTPGSNPLLPQFDAGALKLVVETAHAAGRKVAAHAHSAAGIKNCLEAGVDTIEHATFAAPGGVKSDLDLIKRLADQPVHVVPTLAPWYVLRDSDDVFLGFPQLELSPRFMIEPVLANLALMRSAGVKLVTGTDAGTWRLTPDKFYDEMEGFTQAGFSSIETIAAATGVAAEALGLSAETGSVQVGKQADLIVVAGDPTRKFSVLSQPTLVMKGGEVCFQKPIEGQA